MTTQQASEASHYLERIIGTHQSPGLQYLVRQNGSTVFEKNLGWADLEKQIPVEPRTIFHANSITKTFTALAVLQLVQAGALGLDEPVAAFLDYYPYDREITVHQLLCHTSGLPNPIPLKWIHLHAEQRNFDSKALLHDILKQNRRLRSRPGERFFYSNIGYMLLGAVIEKVSGQSYTEYVQTHILNRLPLGDNPLSFEVANQSPQARGYHPRFSVTNLILGLFLDRKKFVEQSTGRWLKFKDFYVSGSAYGGLNTNARAMIVFLETLMQAGSPLLDDAWKAKLFAPQHTTDGKAIPVGYSWFNGVLNGQKYVTHAGGGGGYYGEIRWYPEHQMATAILFNRSGMQGDERLLDHIDRFFLK